MGRESIDEKTLREWLEKREPVTVVDVRRAEEHAEWSVPGSVNFDAYDKLRSGNPDAMEDLDVPNDGLVVTVCGAGRSSAVAARQLRERGVEALTLEGGMKSWSLAWNTAEVNLPGSEAEIVQIRRTGKGCLSYLVGSGGEVAVIDASVDPEVYVGLAEERGWRITRVLDTHIHADHLSRSSILADLAGAKFYMPVGAPVSYSFSPLSDGDEVRIGASRLEAIRTPGHTMESTCYLLDGRALFTGDTLFLASVGRPDLEADPEEAREKARILYSSLRRVLELDPETLVLPGHTSESVPFDAEPLSATLGKLRSKVVLLREDEETFAEKVAGRVSPTPSNHERIVELNRSGEMPEEDPSELEAGANRCAVG